MNQTPHCSCGCIGRLEATITAQSRLLALAETLVERFESIERHIPYQFTAAIEARKVFTAALTEYQANGAVPCKGE